MKTSRTILMLSSFLTCASLLVSCDKPSAPNPNVAWPFTFEELDGNATLETDRLTIVFEGEQYENRSAGSLEVSGSSGPFRHSTSELDHQYSNGICTVNFRNHEFRLLDGGKSLSMQGTDIDLSQTKKVVTVKKDGSIVAEDK